MTYKNPPVFDSTSKSYDSYNEELKAWCIVKDLNKAKQGLAVALSMPENDASGVRDKVFNEIKLQDLNKDTGVELLIKCFDSLFKRDELSEVYERYTKFARHEKKDQDNMEEFTSEFEKLYNRIKQKSMKLPEDVLAFKLLDACKILHRDRQLVLTGIDYSQKESFFAQMKTSLRKFHGEQSMSTGASAEGCSNKPINLNLAVEYYIVVTMIILEKGIMVVSIMER